MAKQIKQVPPSLMYPVLKKASNFASELLTEREVHSPQDGPRYKVKIPLVSSYKSNQNQTNSDCYAKKNKARVKLETVHTANSNAKSFKRSFEDVSNSPTHTSKPKMFTNAKDSSKQLDQGSKVMRSSLGGGSPQASSSSSKCFSSNRSNNISQCMKQPLPESTLTHLTQKQSKIQPNMPQGHTKVFGSKKLDNLRQTKQPQLKKELSIAEEKCDSTLKQAIIETPKFIDYYSINGKHMKNLNVQDSIRSKSLIKQNLSSIGQSQQYSANFEQRKIMFNAKLEDSLKQSQIVQQVHTRSNLYQSHSSCQQAEEQALLQKSLSLITGKDSENKIPSKNGAFKVPSKGNKSNSSSREGQRYKILKLKKQDINFQKERSSDSKGNMMKRLQDSDSKMNYVIQEGNRKGYDTKALKIESNFDCNGLSSGRWPQIMGSPKVQQKSEHEKEMESFISDEPYSQDEDAIQQDRRNASSRCMQKNETKINYENYINNKLSEQLKFNSEKYQDPLIFKSSKVIKKAIESQIKKSGKETAKPQKSLPLFQEKIKNIYVHKNQVEPGSDSPKLLNIQSKENLLKNSIKEILHSSEATTFREITQKFVNQNPSSRFSYHKANEDLKLSQISKENKTEQEYRKSRNLNCRSVKLDKSPDATLSSSQQELILSINDENKSEKLQLLLTKAQDIKSSIGSKMSFVLNEGNLQSFRNQIVQRSPLFKDTKTKAKSLQFIEELIIKRIAESLLGYLEISEIHLFTIAFASSQNEEVLHILTQASQICLFQRQFLLSETVAYLKQRFISRMNYINTDLVKYYKSISSKKSEVDFDIEKDIERTFPYDPLFSQNSENYFKMYRILRATAYHLPQIGYVQGINFIAGNLIKLIKNEEQVFWILVGILSGRSILGFYTDGMPGLKLVEYQISCFIQNLMPEVELFFNKNGIIIEYFSSQWLLTLFSFEFGSSFFINFLLSFLLNGHKFLIQISLSLLDYIKEELLEQPDLEQALNLIREFPKTSELPTEYLIQKALEFTEVTNYKLTKLKKLFSQSTKKQKVLFLKDTDNNRTYLKPLPNYPDEEQATECNVDDDSQCSQDEFSFHYKKRKINNSFYLNNASGLDIKQTVDEDYNNVEEESFSLPYQEKDPKDRNYDKLNVQLVLEEEEFSYLQDYRKESQNIVFSKEYGTTCQNEKGKNLIKGSQLISFINKSQTVEEDGTPVISSYMKVSKAVSKGSKGFGIVKFEGQDCNQRQSDIQMQQIQKKLLVQSPSLDNIRQSTLSKIDNSKLNSNIRIDSMVFSPNSEDLLESEKKISPKRLNIEKEINKLEKFKGKAQYYSLVNQKAKADETINSHNISNIEEFQMDYNYKDYQFTKRGDNRDDLTERDSLKLSWAKTRPLNRDLLEQFEIKKVGSHLNTPLFQQTNRSPHIMQEKRINDPKKSDEFKKSAFILLGGKISQEENADPNNQNFIMERLLAEGISVSQQATERHAIRNQSLEENENQQSRQQMNNFQRFSATQKNPFEKNHLLKIQQKSLNQIIHNWSANTNSAASNNVIEEVIYSIKSTTKPKKAKIFTKQGIPQGLSTSNAKKQKEQSVRNKSKQPQVGLIIGEGQMLMSPRTLAVNTNKQSQKLHGHMGDNFCDEGDTTTIITPKDSFQVVKQTRNKNYNNQ